MVLAMGIVSWLPGLRGGRPARFHCLCCMDAYAGFMLQGTLLLRDSYESQFFTKLVR